MPSPGTMSSNKAQRKKKSQLRPINNRYILAITFVNYLIKKHGVPKVMLSHQEMFLQNRISYVAIFPVKKLLFHDKLMLFCMYGLIIDGEYAGVYQMNQIISMLLEWNDSGIRMLNIHIHHLLYTNWKTIGLLIDTFSNVPIKIYLHDFYLACSNYNLLINGKDYCGGDGFGSIACHRCSAYSASKKHAKKVQDLLSKISSRTLFISPSQSTKVIFSHFYPEYSNKIIVIPHQIYEGHYRGNLNLLKEGDPINVAFIGWPQYHKGWETWLKIIDNAPKDQYNFYVFNNDSESYSYNIKKVNVSFSKDQLNAMGETLRSYNINVVLLWSLCPETYSYTYSEAYSANAFIITNTISGNICDSVNRNHNGICLQNEEDVIILFEDAGNLRNMINNFRINTPGGPKDIPENDEIVKLVKSEADFGDININNCLRGIHRITNEPLLWLLNWIYQKIQ